MNETNETLVNFVASIKKFRTEIDSNIQTAEEFLSRPKDDSRIVNLNYGREMALVRTKLQEAKMWAGKVLEVVGNPFPADLADKAKL